MDLRGSGGLVVAFHYAEQKWSIHIRPRFNNNVVQYFF